MNATHSTPTQRHKILIVDDNRTVRYLLKLTLAENIFQLFEAECAEEALQIVNQELPDVIILDVSMPGTLNGFEVCNIIKANPVSSACKVILLTALCQAEDIKAGELVGADAYVTKPFSPKALLQQIKEHLNLS